MGEQDTDDPIGTKGDLRREPTVKWFTENEEVFVEPSEDSGDLFVHHSSIGSDGYKKLEPGAVVDFDADVADAESPDDEDAAGSSDETVEQGDQ